MRIFLLALIIFVLHYTVIVHCNELVTVWAPRVTQQDEVYNVLFMPTNLQKKTEISVQFRHLNVTSMLRNEKYQSIEYPNTNLYGSKQDMDLFVTLLRNQTSKSKICATQELKIPTENREFYIFIQQDKPIYKPGDEIKIRAVVIDRNLKPYQMNNINVTIHDPLNRIIYDFGDLEGQHIGVAEMEYKLTDYAILGDWKVRVEVNKNGKFAVSKKFPVQKYVLPLFDVNIDLSEKHLMRSSNLTISINAKYSFGEFVEGNAELTIKNADNGRVYKTQKFEYVKDIERVTYNIHSDLGVREVPDSVDYIKLEAMVVFEEPESRLKFNKTVPFYIHNDMAHKIVAVHPEKYLPGFPFVVKISIYDWQNNKVREHIDRVTLITSFKKTNGHTGSVINPKFLNDGVAVYEIVPEMDYVDFNIEAQFVNSRTYRKTIEQGKVGVAINGLSVEFLPIKPKIHETVKVYVKSDIEMEEIIMVVSTKKGIVKSQQISCYEKNTCEFDLEIKEHMMPYSTVTVYHVVDKLHIYQGSTNIETDELGANELSLKLSKTNVRTKETIKMTFKTKEKSKIHVLAFDKRLTFLNRENNDVTREDVRATLADFDKFNNVMSFDVSDATMWHPCTQEELVRVEKSRKFLGQQSGDVLRPMDDSDDEDVEPFSTDNDVIEEEQEATPDPEILRKEFPETWIFETHKMAKKQQTFEKDYIVPDAMTTWLISAFSTAKDQRLAMAPTQELTVRNDFFVKMNLPYSIKFKEVLRLDILVYNYADTGEKLDVTVHLDNLQKRTKTSNALTREFEFVEYSNENNECSAKYNTNPKSSKNVAVPNMSVKKVSFYIRSNPKDNEFEKNVQNKILLQVRASARGLGHEYQDAVHKRLLVEPVGVNDYQIRSKPFKMTGKNMTDNSIYGNITDYAIDDIRGYPRTNVIVAGDYLTDMMKLDSKFDFYPWDCLEQRTSKFKGNVEYYRYRLSKKTNPSKGQFTSYYEKILNEGMNRVWSYRTDSGYRGYFIEAFTTALELGVIPSNQQSQSVVENELKVLKSYQQTDGSFPVSGFPFYSSDQTNTAVYRDTAYALIAFLKYQKFKKDTNLHSDVIEKGFEYLSVKHGNYDVGNYGLSVAAFAYALAGKNRTAEDHLKKIETSKIINEKNEKCYKINRNDASCYLRHTVYVGLAYLELEKMDQAQSIVNWLLQGYQINYFYANTFGYAITTEVIAKMAIYLKSSKTNLKVTISDEFGNSKSVELTESNSHRPRDFELSRYTRHVTFNIEGHGFCAITTIFEAKVYTDKVSPFFDVSINPNATGTNLQVDEKIIRVCFNYTFDDFPLLNVINEVNIPSGYIYMEVVNLGSISNDLKLVEPKRKKTRVLLYYDNVHRKVDKVQKEYCADIKIKQLYDVRSMQPAGVKVYDFNKKNNIAIEFYKLSSDDC